MWLSQENEHCIGTEDHQSPSQNGSQTLSSLSQAFPKSARILKRKTFRELSKDSFKFDGAFFRVYYRFGHSKTQRLGLSAPKSFGNAVTRNFFKRRAREVFRKNYHLLPLSIELNIYPKKKSSYREIEEDFLEFARRVKSDTQ